MISFSRVKTPSFRGGGMLALSAAAKKAVIVVAVQRRPIDDPPALAGFKPLCPSECEWKRRSS